MAAHYSSPYTTPSHEYDPGYMSPGGMRTPSATPSPRAPYYAAPPGHGYTAVQTPQRPATRAHFRGLSSTGYEAGSFSPRQTISPRYNSGGQYATGDPNVSSTRKHLWSSSSPRPKHERRSSFSYRTSTPHGESDEDEVIEADGVAYVIPAKSRTRRPSNVIYHVSRGHGTDHYRSEQFPSFPDDERKTHARHSTYGPPPAHYQPPPPQLQPLRHSQTPAPEGSRRSGHARRTSTAAQGIDRPQTVRPEASRRVENPVSRRPEASGRHHSSKKSHAAIPPAASPTVEPRKATQADADRCEIPKGFSLKNWDPSEEPILLLGSVFDSNSLGKWIYDWTVFRDGPNTPMTSIAGDLWLLLIQLSGKVKRAAKVYPSIRNKEMKEVCNDFIEAGERLTDKLRDVLAACEQPMLEASKANARAKLGKGAGVGFIDTLLGRDQLLGQTEKFMQAVRTWNMRYDANMEDILRAPTK